MGLYPKIEVTVKIEDQEVLHLGAIDDGGTAMSLCPGDAERSLVASALVEALLMVTGPRPGPMPNITVVDGMGRTLPRKPASHLRVVPPVKND